MILKVFSNLNYSVILWFVGKVASALFKKTETEQTDFSEELVTFYYSTEKLLWVRRCCSLRLFLKQYIQSHVQSDCFYERLCVTLLCNTVHKANLFLLPPVIGTVACGYSKQLAHWAGCVLHVYHNFHLIKTALWIQIVVDTTDRASGETSTFLKGNPSHLFQT